MIFFSLCDWVDPLSITEPASADWQKKTEEWVVGGPASDLARVEPTATHFTLPANSCLLSSSCPACLIATNISNGLSIFMALLLADLSLQQHTTVEGLDSSMNYRRINKWFPIIRSGE